jgi:hypothetical protein
MKKPLYTLDRKVGWFGEPVWTLLIREIYLLPLIRNKISALQPITSPYTENMRAFIAFNCLWIGICRGLLRKGQVFFGFHRRG